VTRRIPASLLALLIATSAASANSSPRRGTEGAGWSRVPVTGSSGEQMFHRYCWECHGDGPDRPGTDALRVKYKGDVPARLDQRTDLNAAFVIATVRHGISVMPAARKTEISDVELNAIAAYLTREKR